MKISQEEARTHLKFQWKELMSSMADVLISIFSEDRKIKE